MRAYLLLMLRAYKTLLSPLLPDACRFVPTCSEYAAEAIEKCGAFRGSIKAFWRLLRCNPFTAGGYDPVVLQEKSVGEPVCVCHAHKVTSAPMEPAPLSPASHISSSLNLRLNHFWRC
jgi:putative membrane protein insertion efficiency factor